MNVSREARGTVCAKCGNEPRVSGQRWGANCKNAYMRQWRKADRERIEAIADENYRQYVESLVRRMA